MEARRIWFQNLRHHFAHEHWIRARYLRPENPTFGFPSQDLVWRRTFATQAQTSKPGDVRDKSGRLLPPAPETTAMKCHHEN
jgi:hypothetical protein